MTNDTLLFAAAQLKKYCENTKCEKCIFVKTFPDKKFVDCRIDNAPEFWEIDELIGENH